MSDYENYLKQQQAERGRVYNDMTLDERLAEFIEYCQQKTERYLVIDAHMEIFNLRDENTRLDDALAATAAELTDATAQVLRLNEENRLLLEQLQESIHRAQEAEYNLHLMSKQADTFHAENGRLRQQQERTTTIARPYSGGLDCEGDGSGPGWCNHDAVWEIQRMQDDGSHYSYVCDGHLSDYQKWADGKGYAPLVFETE